MFFLGVKLLVIPLHHPKHMIITCFSLSQTQTHSVRPPRTRGLQAAGPGAGVLRPPGHATHSQEEAQCCHHSSGRNIGVTILIINCPGVSSQPALLPALPPVLRHLPSRRPGSHQDHFAGVPGVEE